MKKSEKRRLILEGAEFQLTNPCTSVTPNRDSKSFWFDKGRKLMQNIINRRPDIGDMLSRSARHIEKLRETRELLSGLDGKLYDEPCVDCQFIVFCHTEGWTCPIFRRFVTKPAQTWDVIGPRIPDLTWDNSFSGDDSDA